MARRLEPVAGHSKDVGFLLAVLDEGLAEIKTRARGIPAANFHRRPGREGATVAEIVLHAALVETRWIHEGIGLRPPRPAGPGPDAAPDAIFAHLDAVRATTREVLRALSDADLDGERSPRDCEGKPLEPATIRRILFDMVEFQSFQWGKAVVVARLLSP